MVNQQQTNYKYQVHITLEPFYYEFYSPLEVAEIDLEKLAKRHFVSSYDKAINIVDATVEIIKMVPAVSTNAIFSS